MHNEQIEETSFSWLRSNKIVPPSKRTWSLAVMSSNPNYNGGSLLPSKAGPRFKPHRQSALSCHCPAGVCFLQSSGPHLLDPSAAPPPLFRLAQTKSGWRAHQNSAGGGGRLFRRRRRNSARPRERRHITLLVSLSMEHVVATASVVTVGYFGAH